MKACRYSFTLSLTSEVYSAWWSRPRSGRFNPRKREPVPTLQDDGRASRPDNNNNNNDNVRNNYFTIFNYSHLQTTYEKLKQDLRNPLKYI